ncbi:hypothetical protein [Mycobacteroides abscessus]|uniref:hypothetical protein n=1 Tax=Mycobacteroides abscessus TaxID=36809 RepID=UPI0012FFF6FB|nr:hypothetical protein [Mycobacteroides abscessus]
MSSDVQTYDPAVQIFRQALTAHPDLAQHVAAVVDPQRTARIASFPFHPDTNALHALLARPVMRPYLRRIEFRHGLRSMFATAKLMVPAYIAGILLSQLFDGSTPLMSRVPVLVLCGVGLLAAMILPHVWFVAKAEPCRQAGIYLTLAYYTIAYGDDSFNVQFGSPDEQGP